MYLAEESRKTDRSGGTGLFNSMQKANYSEPQITFFTTGIAWSPEGSLEVTFSTFPALHDEPVTFPFSLACSVPECRWTLLWKHASPTGQGQRRGCGSGSLLLSMIAGGAKA
nr:hypothetical protein Itr_chr02CG10510 [Ipomoea trifida]